MLVAPCLSSPLRISAGTSQLYSIRRTIGLAGSAKLATDFQECNAKKRPLATKASLATVHFWYGKPSKSGKIKYH